MEPNPELRLEDARSISGGLRAQVFERIEVLEEQERERKVLLSEVAAMAEEHGLDAGALKAVVGG